MKELTKLTELQEKRIKFLDDTVAYFNIHPRGVNERGTCSYSAGCAIGRHLPPDICIELDRDPETSVTSIFDCEELLALIPDELKSLGRDFLQTVQLLHDDSTLWYGNGRHESGLNEYGESEHLSIKEKIKAYHDYSNENHE